MNSNHCAHASAGSAGFDGTVLSCSTRTEPIQVQQLVRGWQSLGTVSRESFHCEVITGRTRHSAGASAVTTVPPRHAIITDDLVDSSDKLNKQWEQAKMFEINSNAITMQILDKPVTHVTGDVCFVDTEGLEYLVKCGVAYALNRSEERGVDVQKDLLCVGIYSAYHYSYIGPEFMPYNLERRSCEFSFVRPQLVVSEYAYALVTVEEGIALIEERVGHKLHKQVHLIVQKIIDGEIAGNRWTRGDLSVNSAGEVLLSELARLCICLHSLCSNHMGFVAGTGFKDGQPMMILAVPQFGGPDAFSFKGFKLVEQRAGKFYQTLYGNLWDAREHLENLKVLNKEPRVHLCVTEQEWHEAYKHGPSSCMVRRDFNVSPVRCYADNEELRLLIAYKGELFGEDFEVSVRAIVNIERMTYVRAYGSNSDALLRHLGYTHDSDDSLNGCTLKKIPNPESNGGGWLMPYLDGCCDNVDDEGDFWRIVFSGNFCADNADGYIDVTGYGGCECCGHHAALGDLQETNDLYCVCQNCVDSHYVHVEGWDLPVHESDVVYLEGEDVYVHRHDAELCELQRQWFRSGECTSALVDPGNYLIVHDGLLEYSDVHEDYILTAAAAADYGYDYMGEVEEEV